MTRPTQALTIMILFVGVLAALGVLLGGALAEFFLANLYLNGLIAAVWLVGLGHVFTQLLRLGPEIDWVDSYRGQEERASLPPPPKLLAPVSALLVDKPGRSLTLSAMSLRSLLDGVANRLDEARETSRYITGLLVFLGLLGTFWGLLGTIGAISNTISGIAVDGGDLTLAFADLKVGLQGPLAGMATAFSSSLFGLAGSVTLGFLDLQAGRGLNRFYQEVEDWLTSITKLTGGADLPALAGGGAGTPDSYASALMEQTAEELSDLNRTLGKAEADRAQSAAATLSLAEGIAALADHLQAQRKAAAQAAELQRETRDLLATLVRAQEATEPGLDDESRAHLRNLDLGLKRLAELQARAPGETADALRTDIKLLARSLSRPSDETS